MRKASVVLFLLLLVGGSAWAADEFAGLKCGTDIPKALVGKHGSNEPVAAVEKRHADLGLKNLGSDDVTDDLFVESWKICGSEYELLVDSKGLIHDAVAIPAHSKASPMSIGECRAAGKPVAHVIAVLNNSAGYDARDEKRAETMLPATAAWRIDLVKQKFVAQPTANLTCPLGGVVTQDGGR